MNAPQIHTFQKEKITENSAGRQKGENKEITDFQKSRRVIWGRLLRIDCDNKSLWEYIRGQLLRVTSVLYPLVLNFPNSHPIFQKTPADCGDKVENCPLFRKQNNLAPNKFLAQEEEQYQQQQQETIG